ncbi:alpha/beta fold hydrolase [Puniceicoccus vermicola]|uniref:Alpha/beta hydrolase n=1 Tax=Puniceicoccus vermicola TaxID=388746 RepID=A0A7X1AVJ8_9BACT|nr:alpha/beta hydrolase [Puniceicoccus vermicola]MBC2600549.1 alpha/beta hydrolase [Puniceicoccus vermicola]
MAINHQSSTSRPNRKGKIHTRILSEGNGSENPPLIILPGLLGSSRNWLTAGRSLGEERRVYALDLPDHGESEWTEEPSFDEMSVRILEWAEEQGIEEADWLGHSLGGKVSMRIASDRPSIVRKLVLADIFPRVYPPHHAKDFAAMASLDLESLSDRKAADSAMAEEVPDWALRQFLLTNLTRSEQGGFAWQVNLEGLHRNLPQLAGMPFGDGDLPIVVPTLLVYGGKSNFVRAEDLEDAEDFFEDLRARRLPESGHNIHVEAKEDFVRTVKDFLKG